MRLFQLITRSEPRRAPPAEDSVDALLKTALAKEAEYNEIVKVVQARLGTEREQPNDIEAVREIVHKLISVGMVIEQAKEVINARAQKKPLIAEELQ